MFNQSNLSRHLCESMNQFSIRPRVLRSFGTSWPLSRPPGDLPGRSFRPGRPSRDLPGRSFRPGRPSGDLTGRSLRPRRPSGALTSRSFRPRRSSGELCGETCMTDINAQVQRNSATVLWRVHSSILYIGDKKCTKLVSAIT